MANTLGVDYASVDGNLPPGFSDAKAAGIRFAIPRAIYGRPVAGGTRAPFLDPVWDRDKARIVGAGLKRSAYIFVCMPKSGVYTPQPEDQAQAFIDYVGHDLEPANDHDLPPMFDVEEDSTLTPHEYYAWVSRVATKLKDFYGAWPGMYTSARVWNEYLNNHPAGDLGNCPLWLAKPWPWAIRTTAHLTDPPASPNMIPAFGNQWFVYQYQGDALKCPGFNKTVDLNRFRVFGIGAKGDHVKWVQARLDGLVVDGDFGSKTSLAVKSFQTQHGLAPDGFVGLDTTTALAWGLPRVPYPYR